MSLFSELLETKVTQLRIHFIIWYPKTIDIFEAVCFSQENIALLCENSIDNDLKLFNAAILNKYLEQWFPIRQLKIVLGFSLAKTIEQS